MKRYRHYKKSRALVLSLFGSVIEQQKYLDLKSYLKSKFEEFDIFIAISSRMVLKDLLKNGYDYKNLPQTLADVDMLGYKNIIVSSINLFPTQEHQVAKEITKSFDSFSPSNIRITDAILTKTKDTTLFFSYLNSQFAKDDVASLYIIHGTPMLETHGIESIDYSANLLKELHPNNFSCSLEGAYPFFAMKETIISQIKSKGLKRVQIIPLLLVSGNHYIKDMVEIRDELSEYFDSMIVNTLSDSQYFNLIELPKVREIITRNIKESIIKLGH
jgi:sirohydrochlorin cobaltochelatase